MPLIQRLRSVAALLSILALVTPLYLIDGFAHRPQAASAATLAQSREILAGGTAPVQSMAPDPEADYEMPDIQLDTFTATSEAELRAREERRQQKIADRWENKTRNALVKEALSYVGDVPYVFGGETTSGWDCSGYTMFLYNKIADVSMEHSVLRQRAIGHVIKKKDAQPGDLVVFSSDTEDGYHVGVYLGNDRMAHAPQPGDFTKVGSIFIQAGDKIQFVNVLGLSPDAPKGYDWPKAVADGNSDDK